MQSFLEKRTEEGIRNRAICPSAMPTFCARRSSRPERELALIAKARAGGLLPHRLGHRAVLRTRRHSGAGTRIGGQ
jgi:hypothetical protein